MNADKISERGFARFQRLIHSLTSIRPTGARKSLLSGRLNETPKEPPRLVARTRSRPRPHPVIEELEPRILYSADAHAALLDPGYWAPDVEVRLLEPAAPAHAAAPAAAEAAQQRSHEVVFIDNASGIGQLRFFGFIQVRWCVTACRK